MGIIIPIMGMKSSTTTSPPPSGVADALFGRVRQRVLALLLGHPEQSFYANEIIRWVGSGSGAVQRELARLSAAGLITVTRIGRQRHYQANPTSSIYPEPRGIAVKTFGVSDRLRQALSRLEGQVRAAFVFGSVAKGTDTAQSDIDLMVVSDHLSYAELFGAIEEASTELARPLNPTIYTSEEFARRLREKHPFLRKVLDQRRVWIIGGDDDLPT
jgi:predicted nucleotidyltransferase